ncbi:competence protein ComJ [Shewanella fidelis]|uniref:Competence protein ComJ n=1 Tax=Shewanella fidelis TaxID=173509 RepID=A0AAW8NIK6_9GAMM|nr:competence protein ComJ [Shewanella fidelis]MDR8522565.1 competence protein ComJ [Shewanella fidelis]MDW4812181.1 competence protein ComJ [Shewanella fidelis]MDW4816155.1 competence protein ComJ [Shewanella fidelis]MDW4820422.1 competence protein ComJ [Shewanella fidelis]MDW4824644.1 competence protein ComJ [Shewanella fidelis]
MANLTVQVYLSYSQICVFLSSLTEPFNDWSDRNFSQGFAWRDGSVSFRALVEEGEHRINLFINEPLVELKPNVIRAIRVPFESINGNIEIASISDSTSLEISPGKYALQVEFLSFKEDQVPEINIRFNKGETNFLILKADDEIEKEGKLDLKAIQAT